MKTDPKAEYEKFADAAVHSRREEEGMGRIRMASFVGMAGPLACVLIKVLELSVPKPVVWAILATVPLSLILLVVNYIRLPASLKLSAATIVVALMTLVGAGATFILASQFSLLKAVSAS